MVKRFNATLSFGLAFAACVFHTVCLLVNSGVDIELPAVRRRVDLRRRVLTERECDNLGSVSGLSEEEDVLLRFSMKEAVYKAAHPVLRRPLVFKDVSCAS